VNSEKEEGAGVNDEGGGREGGREGGCTDGRHISIQTRERKQVKGSAHEEEKREQGLKTE